jgi:hypothetical protein
MRFSRPFFIGNIIAFLDLTNNFSQYRLLFVIQLDLKHENVKPNVIYHLRHVDRIDYSLN